MPAFFHVVTWVFRFVPPAAEYRYQGKALRCHASQVERCQMVDLEAIHAAARAYGHTARLRNVEAFEVARFVWDLSTVC